MCPRASPTSPTSPTSRAGTFWTRRKGQPVPIWYRVPVRQDRRFARKAAVSLSRGILHGRCRQENVAVVRQMIDRFNRDGFLPEDLFDPDVELFNVRESPLPGHVQVRSRSSATVVASNPMIAAYASNTSPPAHAGNSAP